MFVKSTRDCKFHSQYKLFELGCRVLGSHSRMMEQMQRH